MTTLPLTQADVQGLEISSNPHDLRRDMHTFVQYVTGRNIKRSYRTNELPAADFNRLAQIMKVDVSERQESYSRYGAEAMNWIDYIDQLTVKMEFVSYDTKGSYRGYTSSAASFPDNFIGFNDQKYRDFLLLPLVEQERRLFDTLVDDFSHGHNEFYRHSVLGVLDRFPEWGSGVGVMPTLNFATIRRFLFDLLQGCVPGVWYSTASLIAYLKANHPYFLIPEKLGTKIQRVAQFQGRYANFYESHAQREPVPDKAKDAFERVEGRYIERFLEGIPFTLGYVDVAYSQMPQALHPTIGQLAAFRINERFLQAMSANIPQPRVIIQPNFEVYVESAFYPAYLISRLSLLADLVKDDPPTALFKLQKQKITSQAAENDGFDVITTLKTLTGSQIPQNVAVEMEEWAGHADVFTLYDGFGLLEGAAPQPMTEPFLVQKIDESLNLIRNPETVRTALRTAGEVVLSIHHREAKLELLPEKAQTRFPQRSAVKAKKEKAPKQAFTIKRETHIALYFPSENIFEKFRKGLLDERCLIEVDKEKWVITLAGRYEAQIKQVLKKLSSTYNLRVEDVE